MTIPLNIRQQVRKRANFACEFCGVKEIDTGSQLTIDHFQPKTKNGTDDLENLIYCCSRCNQYKLDYWPLNSNDLPLWNPRYESSSNHFLEIEDGNLHPLTNIGLFTIKRLRLNRPPLVNYRLQKQKYIEEVRLLSRYQQLIELIEPLHKQMWDLLQEQQSLLKEQQALLKLILGNDK